MSDSKLKLRVSGDGVGVEGNLECFRVERHLFSLNLKAFEGRKHNKGTLKLYLETLNK